jgi:hypothetical protein
MKTHIQIAAILNIASGALSLIAAGTVFLFMAMAGTIVASQGEHEAAGIVGIVAVTVACFLTLIGLPSIIGGWALLAGKTWARPLVLVLAILHLPNIPLGTALGIYTLWALLRQEPQAQMPTHTMQPAI